MFLNENIQNNIVLYASSFDLSIYKLLNSFPEYRVGRIHSVFKGVINFLFEDDRLFSIASEELCNGPYTIRVHNRGNISFKAIGLKVGDKVYLIKDEIRIEDKVLIRLEKGELWTPMAFDISKDNFANFIKNLSIYNDYLQHHGADGGAKYFYLSKFFKKGISLKPSIVERELGKRIDFFLEGLALNRNDLEKGVISLIGLGNGLTPSGDDFITGFNVFLNHMKIEDKGFLLKEIKNILYSNRLSTTDVSRSMLYGSLEGLAAESILDFIFALLYKGKDDFEKMIKRLFAVGSSSGTDI